jgi:hypothetical protein
MPAPTPVPRITPNTRRRPAPAPSLASDSAKQLASFSTRTSRPSARARSSASGRSLSWVELAFLIRPVTDEIAPGVPTPTLARTPSSPSTASTSPRTASIVSA